MTPLARNAVLQALAARYRQCPLGKARYPTRDEARRKLSVINGGNMHTFPCALCGGYHLGHRRGQR